MRILKQKIIFPVIILVVGLSMNAGSYEPGQVYKRIIEKKVIRIGISTHYPPLNFNSGKKGVEIEMAEKLGKFMGVRVVKIPMTVAEFVPAIKSGKVDIVIAGFSRNIQRARTIWFSKPYITLSPGVLVIKGVLPQTRFGDEFEESPIKTIWDLKRVSRFRFAVKKGSTYEYLLNDKMPDMPKVIVKTTEEGLNLLKTGKAHGFVHDSLYLQYLYRTSALYRAPYRLLTGGNLVEKICVGLPFGDTILKNQVDVFIEELIREGLIEEWLKKYDQK
jgi:polar amino acid transport system substrate-binding protein